MSVYRILWCAVLYLAGVGWSTAQEWTRFRGPNGSGVGTATTIPARWTERDYSWKVELPGVGHSSPVLWGERIFITCGDEETGKRVVHCLNAASGERLWSKDYAGGRHGKHQDNSFATASPAVDGQRVYICWGSPKEYLVVALDHAGKEVWRRDLGSFKSGHGFGASPIVVDDLVVVANDQDGATSALYGLEAKSGEIRWKVPRKSKSTYTTPCVYETAGQTAQVIFTNYEHGVTSVDPKSGRVNWEIDVFDKRHLETSIGSPIIAGKLVFGTSGWLGVRQEVVAVRPSGSDGKPEVAYSIDRSVPLCTTPLVKDDLLFLWGDTGIVTCADVATGKVHWRERAPGSYYASPVYAGDNLYGVSRTGEVVVLAAARKYKLLGRNQLGEGSHSTPAIAGGRLYLRTFSHLISVGGKK
jgi:outer membrane protein assembly factor BamB